MVDNVQSLRRGLVLSAHELRKLTGWPDAMIEDYLNIISTLSAVATNLDAETDAINDINQSIEALSGFVSQLIAINDKNIALINAQIAAINTSVSNTLQTQAELLSRLAAFTGQFEKLLLRTNDLEQLVYVG